MTRPFLVGFAIAALALSGCGADQSTDPPRDGARRVMNLWDATGATSRIASYRTELTNTIVKEAADHDDVFVAVLDGQPVTTAGLRDHNFAQAPPEMEGEEAAKANQAFAAGFAHQFIASFGAREAVAGSGQLEGLELAARTPHVAEVMLWSDGIVNERGDGFDLSTASANEVTAEIARWKPKLAGLHDVTVVIVGVGRGVHHLATVEEAHRLFTGLVDGNGGHLVWTPILAQR
ncbi:MAG TPA: hypothetical protein VL988_06325 [Solirubrobacteraceae bacterium]|nr:hypothetical protein [Solirubrobacteraceae bacterium]